MAGHTSRWSRVLVPAEAGTDERYTPQWFLDLVVEILGEIDLDPCADPRRRVPAERHFTKDDDGLAQGWSGRVFLNPPFSDATTWLKHLCVYAESGAVTEAVVLVPVTSLGTSGAELLMRRTASCVTVCKARFGFLNNDYEQLPEGTPVPMSVVYVGPDAERFLRLTSDIGYGLLVHQPHPQHKQRQCSYCGAIFTAQRSTAKFCGATCRSKAHKRKNS